MQAINVAFGGTLIQDIANERPNAQNHQQRNPKDRTSHQISIVPETALYRMMFGAKSKKTMRAHVNSTHHQAIDHLGRGLKANAKSKDGIIEGIESEIHRFVLGVQWHPELLYERNPKQANILKAFVRAARKPR
jgi:putative glutamine amidotransferase